MTTILITVWKKHQYHKHDHTCLYAHTKFQSNLLKPEDDFPFGKLTLHYVVKSMLYTCLYAHTKFQSNLLKPEDDFPFGKLTLHYVVKSMLFA